MVEQRWGYKVVCHGAVVVGFDLRHGGPEERDIVSDWCLDHGLVDLVVDFWDLASKERWSYWNLSDWQKWETRLWWHYHFTAMISPVHPNKFPAKENTLNIPLQPPGPFSSGGWTDCVYQAVQSSQKCTPEPEQASSESTCWAWLDSSRSWECVCRSP